jgi:hypothetical protein
MEKEGLKRSILHLQSNNLEISTLITDRHLQIAKWMREVHPEIDDRFDVWHVAKGQQVAYIQ